MKKRNLIKTLAFFAACCLIFTSCAKKQQEDNTLITINGNSISLEEYMIYLDETVQSYELIGGEDIWETDFDGRTAEEVAKESAYNSVVAVELAKERADSYNVTLSETEESRAATEAGKMAENVGESTESSYYEMALNTVMDKYIYNGVKEAVSKDIIISETQMMAFCDENRDEYTKKLSQAEGKVYYYDSSEKASEDIEKIKNNDLESLSFGYAENISYTVDETKSMFGISRDIGEKGIYGPVSMENGYAVIYIEKITEPLADYVEETMRSDYEEDVKNQIFDTEYSKWLSEADITINNDLWNKIVIENAHK